MAVRRKRDNSHTMEQRYTLLMHYFLILEMCGDVSRRYPKLRKIAAQLPRSYLYDLAGAEVFYKEKTAGKYIREMLDDPDAIKVARQMMAEKKEEDDW